MAISGVLSENVVICGGTTTGGPSGATNQCHTLKDNGQWSLLGAGLEGIRYGGAAAAVNIKGEEFLWITGGHGKNDDELKTTELLSSDGTVRAEKDLPQFRRDHCMLAIGNHVMIIGGVTPTGTTNSVLAYDSQNRFSLKDGPSMMNARAFFLPAQPWSVLPMVAGLSLLS